MDPLPSLVVGCTGSARPYDDSGAREMMSFSSEIGYFIDV